MISSLRSNPSSSLFRKIVSTVALSIPVAVYVNDCCFSLVTVRGSTMNPSLQDGDVVFVRKADFLPYYTSNQSQQIRIKDLMQDDSLLRKRSRDLLEDDSDLQRVRTIDESLGKVPVHPLTFMSSPPCLLTGDVVVFKSKNKSTPIEYQMKRIIALGGQKVSAHRTVETVGPYSIWVESDNKSANLHSSSYGTISKNLVIGKAECIVWPPSRWGKIERIRPSTGRSWWDL